MRDSGRHPNCSPLPVACFLQELQQKNEAANQKLKQMVLDQQEAERQKVHSQEVQAQLELQEKEIAVKRESVVSELAGVEPAVIEAQNGERRRGAGSEWEMRLVRCFR